MTRPDKHAARFGVRYRPRPRPLRPGDMLRLFAVGQFFVPKPPAVRWSFAPHIANLAAPTVAELEAGTPLGLISDGGIPPAAEPTDDGWYVGSTAFRIGGLIGSVTGRVVTQPDILDRIDDTLLTYDSQHADGDQPWPYGRSF